MPARPPAPATAYGTLAIHVPPKSRAAGGSRKPAYVSPGTTSAAVFIDGATTPAGTATCASPTCTLSWKAAVSVPAAHIFAVEVDNGTHVLAENEASYALTFGSNTLATLTLNGVAATSELTAETCSGTTCTGTLQVADSATDPITNSGSNPSFDNGTITYASATPATGTVASGGTIATVSTAGTYAYTTSCAASTGQFQTTMTASIPAGSGDVTAAELTNRSLVYPSSINQLELYRCSTANQIFPGHMYVSTQGGFILVFAGNLSGTLNVAPLATIAGSNTGLSNPLGIALDSSGQIYVANNNSSGNGVSVFAANPSGTLNEVPVATIVGSNTAMNNPSGIGLDSAGKVYVANDSGTNTITVYAASPSGTLNEAPVATITGSNTLINQPEGIGFDSTGRIYTGNNAPSIQVFAASPSGSLNEAPLAMITGSNTGLGVNYGIAVDSSGRIYASNNSNNSITMYAANPSGTMNESPLATITGGNTGLSAGVYRVGTDYNQKVYAGLNSSISVFAANPSGTLNETPLTTISGSNTGITGGAISGFAFR